MKPGHIHLHRRILDNPLWFREPLTMHVFATLLLRANYGHGFLGSVRLAPGECLVSTRELAASYQKRPAWIVKILNALELNGMIERRRAGNHGTIVRIVKWAEYQSGEPGIPVLGVVAASAPSASRPRNTTRQKGVSSVSRSGNATYQKGGASASAWGSANSERKPASASAWGSASVSACGNEQEKNKEQLRKDDCMKSLRRPDGAERRSITKRQLDPYRDRLNAIAEQLGGVRGIADRRFLVQIVFSAHWFLDDDWLETPLRRLEELEAVGRLPRSPFQFARQTWHDECLRRLECSLARVFANIEVPDSLLVPKDPDDTEEFALCQPPSEKQSEKPPKRAAARRKTRRKKSS